MKEYGKIAIFRNEKKEANSKRPDYNGKITVTEDMPAGDYEIGLYITEPKAGGKKYQTGKIREAFKPGERYNVKEEVAKAVKKHESDSFNEDLDDSIPF